MTKISLGTVYPWTVPILCYLQNLISLIREQGKVSSEVHQHYHRAWLGMMRGLYFAAMHTYFIFMTSLHFMQSTSLSYSMVTRTIFTVPLVTIFTKFDGQIIAEYVKLNDMENVQDKWEKARENAENTFQRIYLPKILNSEHPPKAHVQLQGESYEHFLMGDDSFVDMYGHSVRRLSTHNH